MKRVITPQKLGGEAMLALRQRFIPFLVVVFLAIPIGILVGQFIRRENAVLDPKSSGADARPLVIAESCLNFGQVWEQPSFKWLLHLENQTDEELDIVRFNSSCACTSIRPASLIIHPRQTEEIELTIDLTSKSSKKRDILATTEDFAVNIQPSIQEISGLKILDSWEIKGKVKRVLDLDKGFVDFGQFSERLQFLAPRSVKVTSHTPLAGLVVASRSEFFQVATNKLAATDKVAYELVVSPMGNLPIGSYRTMLEVTAHLADGLPTAALPKASVFDWTRV